MRNRAVLSVSLAAMALVLVPSAWSQQEGQQASPRQGENANRGKDTSSAERDTIRGIVAGITAEGETAFDYKTNRGMALEAAFLTVVGSPVKAGEMSPERTNPANAGDNSSTNHRMRHNVYMVWLSPRTKVCEATSGFGRNDANRSAADRNAADEDNGADRGKNMKEVTLDKLEIGDRVEIQFNKREESAANNVTHQSDQMRQKHGRHRTYVVDATAITILTSDARDNDRSGSREKNEKEGSR